MSLFSQAKQIILPAGLSDNLNWKSQELTGIQETLVLWHFDFSFQNVRFTPYDSIVLQSQILAIEHFLKTIWSSFKEKTLGVVLYQGDGDFSAVFPKKLWFNSFLQWIEQFEKKILLEEQEHYYSLYTAQLFAELMQKLVVFLPETCPALLLLEDKEPLAFLCQKFSLERFESFTLLNLEKKELSFLRKDARLGICLPSDLQCDRSTLSLLASILKLLKEKKISFRVIPESKLNYFWHGLDTILVFAKTVSVEGKRLLLGFCASGGSIVVEGDSLYLPNEISVEEFLQVSQSF